VKELPGAENNSPFIMSMLQLDNRWPQNDEVPWCSAFVNYVAWLLRLPRSKSLRARSWLEIGRGVDDWLNDAQPGFDVVILQRGSGPQPGPEVLDAPGHVGFFAGFQGGVQLLGGNQSDTVNISTYSVNRILGVRRLYGD